MASAVVGDGPPRNAVDPGQRDLGSERVVEAPPHRRVDRGDDVIDIAALAYASGAVRIDITERVAVQRVEALLRVGAGRQTYLLLGA